jgi:hypothetical protein
LQSKGHFFAPNNFYENKEESLTSLGHRRCKLGHGITLFTFEHMHKTRQKKEEKPRRLVHK